MKYHLKDIRETLEQVANAIRSALGVHVTIVDQQFNKIITTKPEDLGTIDQHSANALSLRTGELLFIDTPRTHEACKLCGKKESCQEFAEVCAPIRLEDKVIGVIGLVAYDEMQRDYLLSHVDGVKAFILQMGDLVATKIRELDDQHQLKIAHQELDILIEHMERGIIYTDCEGEIKRLNHMIREHTGLEVGMQVPQAFLAGNLDQTTYNQPFMVQVPKLLRGSFDRYRLKDDAIGCGFVFIVEALDQSIRRYLALDAQPVMTTFDDLTGHSQAMRQAIAFAKKAADSHATVLILGESGTGKELFARAIHHHSPRSHQPFVTINCGAIPENLLESELFGYEAGAFTGANVLGKPGKFEIANGGTLFLDEIGDMPLNLQVKLLRVLQERLVERLGSHEPTPIDVRIICATHRNLEEMVGDKEFRQDLYYRIQVLPIMIPPLRERVEDIRLLVVALVNRKLQRTNRHQMPVLSEALLSLFDQHPWTGNVRELENVIEYALTVDTDGVLSVDDLPNRFFQHPSRRLEDQQFLTIEEMEREAINRALLHFGQSKEGIATICKVLGLSRATLYRKMKK